MKKSTRAIVKTPKKRAPAPGKLVGVRLQPGLLKILDKYLREDCPPGTTRPEALRMAFKDWAIAGGRLKIDLSDD